MDLERSVSEFSPVRQRQMWTGNQTLFGRLRPVLLMLLVGILFCLAGGLFYRQHKAKQFETARKNMEELSLAIIQCAKNDFVMPPSVVYSNECKPLYSWRVRMLPYIGQRPLYEKLKLDEPWDSPHNRPLLAKMPAEFEMPGVKAPEGETYFQVFDGASTPLSFQWKARYPASFVSDLGQRILIVEAATSVPWAAPMDIPYSPEKPPLAGVGKHFGKKTLVGLADGKALFFDLETIKEKSLRWCIDLKAPVPGNGDDW